MPVAKSASKLAQIDRRRFHFLIQQAPHFATHVMKTLADRLRHMNAVTATR
jgi:CRP-like cAMP-binding protein